MKTLKISQIQFEAKPTPQENCNQLEKFYKKALKFKPDLICTPECSNIITSDKKHLFKFANFQNDCPVLTMTKKFAKKNKVYIQIYHILYHFRMFCILQKNYLNKNINLFHYH